MTADRPIPFPPFVLIVESTTPAAMTVGCIHIPHYPAWALRRQGSEASLVVVEGGRVVGAGPGAREGGVEVGMTTHRAQSILPDATVLPRDTALEAALWEEIEQKLNATTPYVERDRPGRSFIRPHDEDGLEAVVDEIGAHAALAPTRTDAHLGATKAVAGELLRISSEHACAFRQKLSVHRLTHLGVPEETAERLELFGYDTVAAAADLTKRHLTAQFGDTGKHLYRLLHTDDDPSVAAYTPPPTIEETHRFDLPEGEPGPLKAAIDELLETALEALDGRAAQRLTLRLQCRERGAKVTARILRDPQCSEHALRTTAHTLLDDLLQSDHQVDELTVELGALQQPGGEQGHLFFRRPAVRTAVETVHERYPGVLQRAVLVPDGVFPEDRVRYETAG